MDGDHWANRGIVHKSIGIGTQSGETNVETNNYKARKMDDGRVFVKTDILSGLREIRFYL